MIGKLAKKAVLIASLIVPIMMGLGSSIRAHDQLTNKAPSPMASLISATNHQGPKRAKHLKIGIWNTAGNITTYTIGNSWNDWILWLAFDKLREASPYLGKAQNWLATEIIQTSKDAREWEITLRDDVKWHDGTDFTAEDVAFTFNYYKNGPVNRWTHHTSALPRLEKIEILDRFRLRVTSKLPMPNFDLITAADLPIIQKKQWQSIKNPRTFKGLAIGTGPYQLVDYKANEYYKYKANPHYWNGRPMVDELTLVMIKNLQTMFTALKTGEIDGAARPLPPELVKNWATDPDIEIAKAPSLWGTWLHINLGRKPFDNREIRKAIALAIDPDPMLERIMLGMAQSGSHGWPHIDSFWTRPDLKVPHDPEKAKAIFDQTGMADKNGDGLRDMPNGDPINWEIKVASNRPLLMRASEMVARQLQAVGIQSTVTIVDPASFAGLWKSGQYDLRVMDITPHGIADQDMLVLLHKGDSKRAINPEPEKEAILKRWLKASTRQDRLKASHDLQVYQNQYPNRIMLWYPDGLFAYRWKSYDNYASSAGYGIFHKYSFLPEPARKSTTDALVK